ncbi:MAG: IclR family transcriptional regulator [Acuticoccus sp.]
MTDADRRSSAPALDKGLDIVELLADAGRPLSVREIAERMGRSKNEIFRMVNVLIERGYLARMGPDGLGLTNKLFDIGLKTPRTRDLVTVATPLIDELARRTRQSVHLVLPNRGETVVIASTSGNPDMSFTLRLGYRRPLIDALSGMVLIAFQPAEQRDALIADALPLVKEPRSQSAILREARAIARKGFAERDSPDLVGVRDLAAPILQPNGAAVATLVVSCMKRRERTTDFTAVLADLLSVSAELSTRLYG